MRFKFLIQDRDRHGTERRYVRRFGRSIRIRSEPGTAGFAREYAEAIETLSRPALAGEIAPGSVPYTFEWLALKYFASPDFQNKPVREQRNRRNIINRCLAEELRPGYPLRHCPVHQLTTPKIRELRNIKQKEGKPGAANNRLKYL